MHVIAYSSSSQTQWVIADGGIKREEALTSGLNPFFLSRREISHIIRLELPAPFFRRRWDHVYFYGAGCSNSEKIKTVESSVIAQFKTPTTVSSDLVGAAQGLLLHQEGLVCILSNGANSCHYDGTRIVKNVRPGGFILGDEGSNAYLGKSLVADVLKGMAPKEIEEGFYEFFQTTPDEVMDMIYTQPQPNRTLSDYSKYLHENISHDYCRRLVYEGFISFFRRNISHYDYKSLPLSAVGTACNRYCDLFREAAVSFGVTIATIASSAIPGLIEYHNN